MAIDENKQKALAAALGQIEKQFFLWISRSAQAVCQWAVSLRSTGRNHRVKLP